jgi:hypothetical protein
LLNCGHQVGPIPEHERDQHYQTHMLLECAGMTAL